MGSVGLGVIDVGSMSSVFLFSFINKFYSLY